MKRTLVFPTLLTFTVMGCGTMPTTPGDRTPTTVAECDPACEEGFECVDGECQAVPDDTSSITDRMREACPMLSDELLEAWILAVDGLRESMPDVQDAIEQWVAGCENIPSDGNFQGDQEACAACLPVIVEDVYSHSIL